jgi:EAL domain-containing protein (putative c-di-GMP-specific phosphodiesterase class I)
MTATKIYAYSAADRIASSAAEPDVRLALDDFGKGHSSLYRLRKLRFDHLKIDQFFVHSMDTVESAKIVSAVAGLGRALGMPVTSECVETLAPRLPSGRLRPSLRLSEIPHHGGG